MNKKLFSILISILLIFTIFTANATTLKHTKNNYNFKSKSDTNEYLITHEIIKSVVNLYDSIIHKTPDKWNWRDVNDEDWTTPIKDQCQDECGSCWAFGALGGLESNYKIWMNDSSLDVDLSEQYILSCSSGSCNGWFLSSTLKWIKNNGIILEDCMPYEADDAIPCESKCENWRDQLFGIKSYKKIPRDDINAIREALVTYGPLPATMDVYSDFYPEWNGGVYKQTSDEYVFGHVITIVGYDDTWGGENEGYWICKNSWGAEWGEDGWFRIAYRECNIEDYVYYLEGPNYPPNKPDTPTGTKTGAPGVEYTYISSCVDPDEDELYYIFDWGDGTDSGWFGPYKSSEKVSVNHTWVAKGKYPISVKTKELIGPNIIDIGIESEWSDPFEISIPKNKILNNPLIRLLDNLTNLFQLL